MRRGFAMVGVLSSWALAAPSSAQQLAAQPRESAPDTIVDPWQHAESRGALPAPVSVVEPWHEVEEAGPVAAPVTSGLPKVPEVRVRGLASSRVAFAELPLPSAFATRSLSRWSPSVVDAWVDPWASRPRPASVTARVVARPSWASSHVEVIDPWAERKGTLLEGAQVLPPAAVEAGSKFLTAGASVHGGAVAAPLAARVREPIF